MMKLAIVKKKGAIVGDHRGNQGPSPAAETSLMHQLRHVPCSIRSSMCLIKNGDQIHWLAARSSGDLVAADSSVGCVFRNVTRNVTQVPIGWPN